MIYLLFTFRMAGRVETVYLHEQSEMQNVAHELVQKGCARRPGEIFTFRGIREGATLSASGE
jgi:hypothetical protein